MACSRKAHAMSRRSHMTAILALQRPGYAAVKALFIDLLLDRRQEPPDEIILDLDATEPTGSTRPPGPPSHVTIDAERSEGPVAASGRSASAPAGCSAAIGPADYSAAIGKACHSRRPRISSATRNASSSACAPLSRGSHCVW